MRHGLRFRFRMLWMLWPSHSAVYRFHSWTRLLIQTSPPPPGRQFHFVYYPIWEKLQSWCMLYSPLFQFQLVSSCSVLVFYIKKTVHAQHLLCQSESCTFRWDRLYAASPRCGAIFILRRRSSYDRFFIDFTNFVALRWTRSIILMSWAVYGPIACIQYSRWGRTYVVNSILKFTMLILSNEAFIRRSAVIPLLAAF